jgi:hypothetical protein
MGDNEEKSDQNDRAEGGHDGLVGVDCGRLRFGSRQKGTPSGRWIFAGVQKEIGRRAPEFG